MTPRLLTKQDAAEYCGVCVATLDSYIRQGLVPGPVANTRRFDRKAIDMALDKLSKLTSSESQSSTAYEKRQARKRAQANG
ncbi:helix-turn-helix domain-containing protein [uncultured Cohaesibacter sp.]|uniref:helix-turn-helix domain-containing protein n=1 Tax=uncultured Cohaesibacter sp. TaxID=1002546 RepID=UPI002AA6CEF6|nr:helix-turn-helix domain-containing protein [uncultured Cohaesibacter sp.]